MVALYTAGLVQDNSVPPCKDSHLPLSKDWLQGERYSGHNYTLAANTVQRLVAYDHKLAIFNW